MGVGFFFGMLFDKIVVMMEKGMGGIFGFLVVVVVLGVMFGKILYEIGVVDQIVVKMFKFFGYSCVYYVIGFVGLVCVLLLFFEVVIVLLISVVFLMVCYIGMNLVKLVILLFVGVVVVVVFLVSGLVLMLLVLQMNVDFGWMILIGLCVVILGMIIVGLLWGNFISCYVELYIFDDISELYFGEGKMLFFGFSLLLILLLLVLVGLKIIVVCFVLEGFIVYEWFEFIGYLFIVILVVCLVVIYGLVMCQGMLKDKVMEICGYVL